MQRLPTLQPCQPLARTSATASAALSECMFRAGQEHVPETRRLFATSPAALIGTLAHQIIERAYAFPVEAALLLPTQADRIGASARLWAEAERGLLAAYGERGVALRPRGWPHYAMKRARAIALAATILNDRVSTPAEIQEQIIEADYEACDGKLVGKLDRAYKTADGWIIEDLKSGHIRDAGGAVLPQYRRQLLIYAYLLHEAVGEWPRMVRLVTITGAPYEEHLNPSEATDVVAMSLADLQNYNGLVAQHSDDAQAQMEKLATPAPQTCAWCRVRAWCEPYWAMVAGTDDEPGPRSDIQGPLESAWHPGEAMKLRCGPLGTIILGVHPSHLEAAPHSLASGALIRALRVRLQSDAGIAQADLTSEIWWRP